MTVDDYIDTLPVRQTSKRVYRNTLTRYEKAAKGDTSERAVHAFLSTCNEARTHNLAMVVINAYRKWGGLKPVKRKKATVHDHQFNTEKIAGVYPRMLPLCKRVRDRFLLVLLRFSGLRIGEALQLKKEHLAFPNGQLLIHVPDSKTKTGTREVVAWKATREAKAYIPSVPDGCWLFPSNRGGQRHITTNEMSRWVSQVSAQAGYRITPHDFRRLWETQLAEKYGTAFLKDYFGQSSAEIVEIYIDKARGTSKSAIMADLGFEKHDGLFDTTECWKCGCTNEKTAAECCQCHEPLDDVLMPHKKQIESLSPEDLKDLVRQLAKKYGVI